MTQKLILIKLLFLCLYACDSNVNNSNTLAQRAFKIETVNNFINSKYNTYSSFTDNGSELIAFFEPYTSKSAYIYDENLKCIDTVSLKNVLSYGKLACIQFLNRDTLLAVSDYNYQFIYADKIGEVQRIKTLKHLLRDSLNYSYQISILRGSNRFIKNKNKLFFTTSIETKESEKRLSKEVNEMVNNSAQVIEIYNPFMDSLKGKFTYKNLYKNILSNSNYIIEGSNITHLSGDSLLFHSATSDSIYLLYQDEIVKRAKVYSKIWKKKLYIDKVNITNANLNSTLQRNFKKASRIRYVNFHKKRKDFTVIISNPSEFKILIQHYNSNFELLNEEEFQNLGIFISCFNNCIYAYEFDKNMNKQRLIKISTQ